MSAGSLLLGHDYNTANDMDWVTSQIAVGGMLYDSADMAKAKRQGVSHILNMNGADDARLADAFGIEALWNHTPDDFQPKPPILFKRGVNFAKMALANKENKLLIHCAAGIHRAPMMTLAVLASRGWSIEDAMRHIKKCRPCAWFPDVYVNSVRHWLRESRAKRN